MNRLPGSLLFIVASIYLISQGSFDVITLLATLGCALCGVIALSEYSVWSILGGIVLISTSLVLQVLLEFNCLSCLKADVMILGAVICISFVQVGKNRKMAWILTSLMTAVMVGWSTVGAVPVDTVTNAASSSSNTDLKRISKKIQNMAEEKPVLLFSPKCPACGKVTDELIKIDPKGEKWQAVQGAGDAVDGKKYLINKGFQGSFTFEKYIGPVPTLVIKHLDKVEIIHGKDNIIKAIQEYKK